MTCAYLSVVFIIVAFALFPASLVMRDNVDFSVKTSTLTYAALIMPHAPAPLYDIFFSMVVFSLNRKGN